MQIVLGIIGIGVFVFVHELGHFIAAKLSGVEVETFSLGWGRKLIGFEHKGTTYQIAIFPLGGFCKMKGELIATGLEQDKFEEVLNEPGSFLGASWWRKIFISLAGPMANLLFALVVFTLFTLLWYKNIPGTNQILLSPSLPGPDNTEITDTPAKKAGLLDGDIIAAIDGKKVFNFDDISFAVAQKREDPFDLTILREGRTMTMEVEPLTVEDRAMIGITYWRNLVISYVDKNSSASGMEPGDLIYKVNGRELQNTNEFYLYLQEEKPSSMTIEYYKGGRREDSRVLDYGAVNYNPEEGYPIIDFYFSQEKVSLGESVIEGWGMFSSVVGRTLESLYYLITFRFGDLQGAIAGPVRIISIVGEAGVESFKEGISTGLLFFLRFIGFISVAVAVMNLLPLPALDGGMVLFSLVMLITRNKPRLKILVRYQMVGVFIIIILLTIALFSDMFHFIGTK